MDGEEERNIGINRMSLEFVLVTSEKTVVDKRLDKRPDRGRTSDININI